MKYFRNLYLSVLALLFAVSCSTKNNTWLSRNYQNFASKYNIRHNAVNAFEDGQEMLILANQDNYSEIITLYPIVNESTANGITSQMNTTIEKCRKVIKLHSIRSKPTKKPLGMSSREYRQFRNQEEFNPQVPRAWLLLGKASYYKAEFIEAISIFNYIIRHYPENELLVYEAKLWQLRVYTDMGWLHEAESHLSQIKASSVPTSLKATYSAFTANLLVAQKRYEEAIPHLQIAITGAKNRYEKSRFNFVLAQLYEHTGKKNLAQQHYKIAQNSATNYEMIFNAKLRAMILESNTKKAISGLQAMAKSSNNKNYLDQIYYAIGNRYLDDGKEDKAIENYKSAMAKSTRNGVEKALVALKIAEIYYDKKDYIPSSHYYDSVLIAMPSTHVKYKIAESRAQILGELAQNHNTVYRQDSLLNLSYMSEAEQLKVINRVIADLIAAEKLAAKDSADKAASDVAERYSPSFDPIINQQIKGGNDWYFYNTASINQGKNDFRKRWGNRPLEDNWNREVKTMAMTTNRNESQTDISGNDSTSNSQRENDPHNPEYYLVQIPKTEEDRKKANEQIATALYNMGGIFHTKINDIQSADDTYREFQRRFPKDERKAETYFFEYQINGQLNKPEEQALFRNKLISEYPDSKYAMMLANPNYAENMQKMMHIQDNLYQETYDAYTNGNYTKVKQNYNRILQDFPMSEYLPKFAFVNALASAKSGQKDVFEAELDTIITKYPDADITPMSKDILALIRQGREQVVHTGSDNINERRTQEAQIEIAEKQGQTVGYDVKVAERQNIILVPVDNDKNMFNNMIYDIAVYNFNKFIVKDFDFDTRKVGTKEIIIISGIESVEEGKWYRGLLLTDGKFPGKNNIKYFNLIMVSDIDLAKINSEEILDGYLRNESSKQ